MANGHKYLETPVSYFLAVNVILPFFWIGLVELGSFLLPLDKIYYLYVSILILVILIIFSANIFALKRFPIHKRWFAGIGILNLIAFACIGDVSFITAIPMFPFCLTTYWELFTASYSQLR